MGNLDLTFLTENGLITVDGQVVPEVVTLLRPPSTWPPTTSSAAWTAKALKKRLKKISKPAHVSHVRGT